MVDETIEGHEDDILKATEGWDEDETHNPDVPAESHRRGLAPFVFVPFHEVSLFLRFFVFELPCYTASPKVELNLVRH